MLPVHPTAIVCQPATGARHVFTARSIHHDRTLVGLRRVLAASLPPLLDGVRQGGPNKQDPPALAGTEGSNRSTSDATDGRAASAQCDRPIG